MPKASKSPLVTVSSVFAIAYGSKAYHTKSGLSPDPGGTPLIASGGRNNGVYGRFKIAATKEHIITVASTGSAGSACYHGYPCEVSDDALVLTPRATLSKEEMLWYLTGIRSHGFRFGYGRKATPERVGPLSVIGHHSAPPAATATRLADVVGTLASEMRRTKLDRGSPVRLASTGGEQTVGDLFEIEYGNSYELCNLARDAHGVNLVSRTTQHNGVSARVARTDVDPYPAGCLTVGLGSRTGALQTCVQLAPFYTARDVAVLWPKRPMTLEEKLFFCMAIRLHKFRFGFGRQANRTLPELHLPVVPDWATKGQVEKARNRLAVEVGRLAGG